jgi:nitric oxide reductase subunit B
MNIQTYNKLRLDYAIAKNSVKTPERMHLMNAFFFWATVTNRPNDTISYTHNLPNEELV